MTSAGSGSSALLEPTPITGGAGGLEVASGVKVIDSPDFPEWIKPGSKATSNALEQLRNEQELE